MNESSADKTEEPTPKKIRDARKKGQVLQVKDLASLATFFVIFLIVVFVGELMLSEILKFIEYSIRLFEHDGDLAVILGIEAATVFFVISSFVLAGSYIITVIAVKVSEVGLLFSTEPIKMEFKKINPIEGFKRIYSKKSLVEFGKTVLKSFTLLGLVVVVFFIYVRDIVNIYVCDKTCLFPLISEILSTYIIAVVLVFGVITVIDFWIQAVFFKKSMMMTKDEVKREYKESEGSPELKGERKRIHREIMNSPAQAKKSSFVVTNPTHYSIAFLYDRKKYKVPLVYLKGMNEKALLIREEARQAGVPIVENVQLARYLYDAVDELEYIPQDYFKPVSDVIAILIKSGALKFDS